MYSKIFRFILFCVLATAVPVSVSGEDQDFNSYPVPDGIPITIESAQSDTGMSEEEQIQSLEEDMESIRLQRKSAGVGRRAGGMGGAVPGIQINAGDLTADGKGEVLNDATPIDLDFYQESAAMQTFEMLMSLGGQYRISDRVIINSEIEIERTRSYDFGPAGNDLSDSTMAPIAINSSMRFMYANLEVNLDEAFHISLGLIPVSVGLLKKNEVSTYLSAYRPIAEIRILPQDWSQVGILFHGELWDGAIAYNAGIMNAGSSLTFDRDMWLSGLDGSAMESQKNELAYSAGVEYKQIKDLSVSAAYYQGVHSLNSDLPPDSSANFSQNDNNRVIVRIAESYLEYSYGLFTARGLLAQGWLNQIAGARSEYLELRLKIPDLSSKESFLLFFREEYINVFQKLDSPESQDTANGTDRSQIRTVGAVFFPSEKILMKVDYEWNYSTGGDIALLNADIKKIKNEQVNFSLKYIF